MAGWTSKGTSVSDWTRAFAAIALKLRRRNTKQYLKGTDGSALEAEVSLEVLGDLANQALEGQLPDQQLGGLLVSADLTQGHGAGAITVRLLDASSRRGRLARSLGSKLLPRSLSC